MAEAEMYEEKISDTESDMLVNNLLTQIFEFMRPGELKSEKFEKLLSILTYDKFMHIFCYAFTFEELLMQVESLSEMLPDDLDDPEFDFEEVIQLFKKKRSVETCNDLDSLLVALRPNLNQVYSDWMDMFQYWHYKSRRYRIFHQAAHFGYLFKKGTLTIASNLDNNKIPRDGPEKNFLNATKKIQEAFCAKYKCDIPKESEIKTSDNPDEQPCPTCKEAEEKEKKLALSKIDGKSTSSAQQDTTTSPEKCKNEKVEESKASVAESKASVAEPKASVAESEESVAARTAIKELKLALRKVSKISMSSLIVKQRRTEDISEIFKHGKPKTPIPPFQFPSLGPDETQWREPAVEKPPYVIKSKILRKIISQSVVSPNYDQEALLNELMNDGKSVPQIVTPSVKTQLETDTKIVTKTVVSSLYGNGGKDTHDVKLEHSKSMIPTPVLSSQYENNNPIENSVPIALTSTRSSRFENDRRNVAVITAAVKPPGIKLLPGQRTILKATAPSQLNPSQLERKYERHAQMNDYPAPPWKNLKLAPKQNHMCPNTPLSIPDLSGGCDMVFSPSTSTQKEEVPIASTQEETPKNDSDCIKEEVSKTPTVSNDGAVSNTELSQVCDTVVATKEDEPKSSAAIATGVEPIPNEMPNAPKLFGANYHNEEQGVIPKQWSPVASQNGGLAFNASTEAEVKPKQKRITFADKLKKSFIQMQKHANPGKGGETTYYVVKSGPIKKSEKKVSEMTVPSEIAKDHPVRKWGGPPNLMPSPAPLQMLNTVPSLPSLPSRQHELCDAVSNEVDELTAKIPVALRLDDFEPAPVPNSTQDFAASGAIPKAKPEVGINPETPLKTTNQNKRSGRKMVMVARMTHSFHTEDKDAASNVSVKTDVPPPIDKSCHQEVPTTAAAVRNLVNQPSTSADVPNTATSSPISNDNRDADCSNQIVQLKMSKDVAALICPLIPYLEKEPLCCELLNVVGKIIKRCGEICLHNPSAAKAYRDEIDGQGDEPLLNFEIQNGNNGINNPENNMGQAAVQDCAMALPPHSEMREALASFQNLHMNKEMIDPKIPVKASILVRRMVAIQAKEENDRSGEEATPSKHLKMVRKLIRYHLTNNGLTVLHDPNDEDGPVVYYSTYKAMDKVVDEMEYCAAFMGAVTQTPSEFAQNVPSQESPENQ